MYLDNHINDIIQLCKNYRVKYLYAFGSVLRSDFSDNSDIDFIVDLFSTDPIEYAENYYELKFKLQDLLNRPIDLLEERALKNPYLKENINHSKSVIYEA